MPTFWRVTVVYGLTMLVAEAAIFFAEDPLSRSAWLGLLIVCLAFLFLPALVSGMGFARFLGRLPQGREAWRFALWFTLVQVSFLFLALALAMQDFLREESDGVVILVVILTGLAALCLPVSRFAFGLGTRLGVRPH